MTHGEDQLIEQLRKIEALFASTTIGGERSAAEAAMLRIRQRLEEMQESDPPVEYKFRMNNMWSRKLLVALMRRYGLRPYRRYRQRYTTVMAKVPASFVEEVLWPEFKQLDKTLRDYISEVTERVIAESIHNDVTEAEEQAEVKQLS